MQKKDNERFDDELKITLTKTFCNSDDAETLSVLGIRMFRALTTTTVRRSAVGK